LNTNPKDTIALFMRTAMHYPKRTIFALVNSAITVIVSSFIGPLIIASLLQQLQAGTLQLADSVPLIIMYAATQVYGEVIGWRLVLLATWTMETSGQRDLYRRIITKLTDQSMTFHSNRFSGSLVSQTTKLTGAFERFWDTLIFQVTPSLASIVTAIIILGFIFWQYAIFLVILTVIFAISIFFGSRFVAERNREESQASTASNGYVADAVSNILTIKSHGREGFERDELDKKTFFWRNKSLASMRGFLTVSSIYSSLIAVVNVGALTAAIWASEQQVISIAAVYLAITYTFTVARQLWEMNNIMRNYNRIIGDAHDMTQILNETPSVLDRSKKKLVVTKALIDFTDVSFTHDGNQETLFHDFTMHIASGERVGLVGPSGGGKTTLTKLLLRFDDISEGVIAIDGQDISSVSQKSLRENIAYVPQEPMLFHRSLRENIAYGNPDATEEQIREAAKKANALEFIEKLEKGFDTLVGERGVKLSGGQRQRIAIARAILKDAPILVLDEATSALDSESEKLIQDALIKLMKGRTSIVIAHRLSTIAKLDRIVVLDNGTVTEEGTHKQLLHRNGIYARLWGHQSGGFIEE
jgi:ATP-binding cassette subfamily B protein